MKADVELTLVHDGKQWIGRNDSVTARGESLSDLDDDIKRVLQESGEHPAGTRLTVFMGFDFDTIPTWLRQYHNHYLNRLLTVEL